jgi:hypothetical protein
MASIIPNLAQANPVAVAAGDSKGASYKERLDQDLEWALSEGSLYFEGKGEVHATLRRITQRLNEMGIPYAVVGGLALFNHGFRRFTEDVDILVTRDGLKQIHTKLEGLGYVRPFSQSKNLRDTDSGVKIEFLVTGQFPGDGKPKPIAFPDPSDVAIERNGMKFLNLETLIELKLASGLTNVGRGKDLVDVQSLIKELRLPMDLVGRLNPFVQNEYRRLWTNEFGTAKRYLRLWRNKSLTIDASNIGEMVAKLKAAAEELEAMRTAGVTLDSESSTDDDYAHLVTTDPDVANKFGMIEESEFWGDDMDEDKSSQPKNDR